MMIAFADVKAQGAYAGSLLTANDVRDLFTMWMMLACACHAFVIIFAWKGVGGRKRKSQDNWYRHSRLFQCQKRRIRRIKDGQDSCIGISWECPLTTLRRMPPPLPLHRRRDHCKQRGSKAIVETIVEESPLQDSSSKLSTENQLHQQELALHESSRVSKSQPIKAKTITTRPRPAQTSAIDLARMQQWSRLIDRVTSNRREAKQVDWDGLMPLHWACSGGPSLEVIQALLQAYPRASSRVDSEGSTALHFACHYGASISVVQTLLGANPEAVRVKDKYGRTPLFHAVSKAAKVDVVRALIDAEPLMVIEPCLSPPSDRPLGTRERGALQPRTPLFMAWNAVNVLQSRRRPTTGRVLDKANMLLEAAYLQSMPRRTYRVMHAAVELDFYLPPHVIRFAIEHYPEQLRQKDEQDGRLPLAIAAELRSPSAANVIQLLCIAFPQAAWALDVHGQSALAIALKSGKQWNDGVKAIFDAAPLALKWLDRQSRLYPALIAASAADEQYDEETIGVSEYNAKQISLPPMSSSQDKALHWRAHFLTNVAVDDKTTPPASEWTGSDADLRRLTTIYEFIRAEPAIVKW